jgi:hypothetical protein
MKRVLSNVIVILILPLSLYAQTTPDAAELTNLLKEFLAAASRNDAAMHDRFWAEELIYTGAAGRRMGKAEIMRGVRSAPVPKPADPTITYTGEDIRIRQYGNTAIVAFRLVATTHNSGKTEVTNYLNTGNFLKRSGKWQAVSWQATRMPPPEEQASKEVAGTEAAFHQAILTADTKKLESLIDETFIWTHHTGEQVTPQQLIDQLISGRLKYSKLETSNVNISVYGDAAVVRGVSVRQRSAIPGSDGSGDASPFTAFYTLTFVNKDGVWKAVAMHSSRP